MNTTDYDININTCFVAIVGRLVGEVLSLEFLAFASAALADND